MRKIVAILSTFFMFLLSAFSVEAENVEMVLSADTAFVDKLFDVSVTSEDAYDISGGMITLNYDSNVVEFMDVNSERFDVEYNSSGDAVKVAFVLDDASYENNEVVKFRFKGKQEAKTDMQLVSSEIVDHKLNVVQTKCVYDCNISVNKKDNCVENGKGDEVKTQASDDSAASANSYSIERKASDKTQKALYIAGSVTACVTVILNIRLLLSKER